MIVTPNLEQHFNDNPTRSPEQIKEHLDSLDLFPEFRIKVEAIFLSENPEDALHPDVTRWLIDENRNITWANSVREAVFKIAA